MFEGMKLNGALLKSVGRAGYTEPTPVQQLAIPPAMEGRDVIATAETGSGKTAAFVLPMLHHIMKDRGPVRALVLCPTREIALQTHAEALKLGGGTGVRSAPIYGGVGYDAQLKALKRGASIIVATPGRLLDHLGRGSLDLTSVQILVLDEADRMLDMGFMPDIRRILGRLPARHQTLLYSATMPPEILKLTKRLMENPVRVEVGELAQPPEAIRQVLYLVKHQEKTDALVQLLGDQSMTGVLVFARTRHRTERLSKQLVRAGISAARIHGSRSQGQREAALGGFRKGQYRVLVATDIAARGLDVDRITHVINYDMPGTPDDYVHRIGRTARAGGDGCAISLATEDDAAVMRDIEWALGYRISLSRLPARGRTAGRSRR